MASTLSSPRIEAKISGQIAKAATQTSSAAASINDATAVSPSIGATTGLISKAYSGTVSVTTSGLTLDLTSLEDSLGEAVVFTLVRAIKITNRSTASGEDLSVGGGASNDWIALLPFTLNSSATGDATVLIDFGADGLIVSGTNKNLLLDVAAGTVAIDVTIVGY